MQSRSRHGQPRVDQLLTTLHLAEPVRSFPLPQPDPVVRMHPHLGSKFEFVSAKHPDDVP